MAQTKTKAATRKPRKSQTRSRGKPKTNSSSKAKAKARSSSDSHSPKTKARSSSKPKAALPDKAKAAGATVEETAKDAGRAVGRAASKAKVPLMAGGAALAGAAGGLALGAHQRPAHRHRSIRGIDSDDVAKAARKVGDFSMQIGELALEARRAREAANGRTHRSPLEVVLEGLTARRQRS